MTIIYRNSPIFIGDSSMLEFVLKDMNLAKEDVTIEYTKEEQKLHTDYNGTDVSLTSKDAVGLLQVKAAFELGVTETKFLFENGTVMDMTPAVFAEFASWFANKRNEFFTS